MAQPQIVLYKFVNTRLFLAYQHKGYTLSQDESHGTCIEHATKAFASTPCTSLEFLRAKSVSSP